MRGQMSNGFADDLEVADNRVDGLLVRLKLFERQTLDISLDSGDRLEDVLDAQSAFPRRQPPPRRESGPEAAA